MPSWSHGGFTGFHSDLTAYLLLEDGHDISASSAMELAYEITALWSLLSGCHIAPRFVYFEKLYERDERPRVDELHIYVPLGDLAHVDDVHPGDILLYYDLAKDIIGRVFDNWMMKRERDRAVRGLFFRSFREQRKRRYGLEQFLNYISALEVFAREHEVGTIISKSDAKNFVKNCARS